MADHSFEQRLAPHVDPAWSEAFILEARLRGVLGTVIGDALAEVDAHVVDSGQSAEEAFGDPKEYAHHFPVDAAAGTGFANVILPPALQVFGMLAVLQAVWPLRHGDGVPLTVGLLVMAALLVAGFVALAMCPTPILRAATSRPVVGAACAAAFFAACIGACFIPGTVATVSGWWVLGVGVALLAIGVMLGIERSVRGVDADPIVRPNEITKPVNLLAAMAPSLIVPVVTAVLAAIQLTL